MARVQVRLNREGIGAFLQSPQVARMVRASGERIARSAGRGAVADTYLPTTTARSGWPRVISGVKFPRKVSRAEALRAAASARGAGRL